MVVVDARVHDRDVDAAAAVPELAAARCPRRSCVIANARSGSKAFGVWSSVTVSTGWMATTPSRLRICGTASSRTEIEMPLKSVLKAKRSS